MGAKIRVWCRVEGPVVLVLMGFSLQVGGVQLLQSVSSLSHAVFRTQGKFQTSDKREAADKAGL